MSELDFEGEKQSQVLIAIDGRSGAGKGTVAQHISEFLGVDHYSAGSFFRDIAKERGLSVEELSREADKETDMEVDRRTFEKAVSENCVIESRISCHILDDYSDLKIRLKADLDERARRVSEREEITLKQAKEQVKDRDRNDSRRYKEYYNLDIGDLSIYDLVIDNTELSIDETNQLIQKALEIHDVRNT